MTTYDMYGFGAQDIEAVRKELTAILSVVFRMRDSINRGVYYVAETPSASFVLFCNLDPEDGGPIEERFPNHETILNADRLEEPDAVRNLLAQARGIVHLSRKVFDD